MKKAAAADFPKFEAELLKVWEKERTFAKSLEQRKGAKRFSFYDGPPYANGLPHYGHVVPVTIKDAVTRYKTMRGYYVPRRLGWDTHGLPVENEIEKQLGLKDKRAIIEFGIDKFNAACRNSVFKYRKEWESFFDRIGRWADKEHSYATLDTDFTESVWWAFAELYKKGLVYQGKRSMPYCPRCATPLSNFELNQGYKDGVRDPSLFVKFKLADERAYLLAWTTTPWTLPGNAALAVAPNADYTRIEYRNDEGKPEKLILAKQRLEIIDGDYKIEEEFKGQDLVGRQFEPLFKLDTEPYPNRKNLYQVWGADFVSLEEGTGIVHIAPAFGEDDLGLGQANDIPLLVTVDEFGKIADLPGLEEWSGQFVKAADPHLIEYLAKAYRLFSAETIEHTYPFCYRCDTPLLYYAVNSWFIKVTAFRDRLLKNNRQINWVPEHLRDGRFGNWLADARDWGVSRNRFWGAAIPLWQCPDGHWTAVSSLKELRAKSASKLPDPIDLHKPAVDGIKLKCDECGQPATRTPEVLDCWFESGSMPYAQDHYPFENKAGFKKIFPADFIAEGIDQTRGWFYTLHVLASALFDQPAFKNVITNGWIVAADGLKLSKRLKNYPPVEEVFEKYGADALRLFMMASPAAGGEDVRFSTDSLSDVQRNWLMTLWNVYSFFTTYAAAAKWQPPKSSKLKADSSNLLDQWLVSRINQVTAEMTKAADNYQLARAVRPLRDLVDDLSNWYVRRSRRRVWRNEDKADQQAAFETLYWALLRISQLFAPWAPFISDKLHRELTGESVHLTDWPAAGQINQKLLENMQVMRQTVTEGLAQRAAAGIKVRQPLSEAAIASPTILPGELLKIAAEELNVKLVRQKKSQTMAVSLNTKITQELQAEGMVREVIRQVQQLRKEAGLEPADRIKLGLHTSQSELQEAINRHADLILIETLASLELKLGGKAKTVQIEGAALEIKLVKDA